MSPPPVDRDALRPAAVGVGALVGGGLFYVPQGVGTTSGPTAPLAYLFATVGMGGVALGLAVLASSPLGERPGGLYRDLSRLYDSRPAGFLLAWPLPLAYAAVLAALANWLAALAPLPPSGGAFVAGVADDPVALSPLAEFAPGAAAYLGSGATDAVAVGLLAAAFGVHMLGPRTAVRVGAALTLAVVVPVAVAVAAAFVPGVGKLVPANFDPLFPTPMLREAPLPAFALGTAGALLPFLGLEAVSTARAAAADPRRAVPRGYAVVLAAVGGLVVATSFVALATVDWVRLMLTDIPAAEAFAGYLPVDPRLATAVGGTLASAAALVAVGWPAGRTLAGLGELLPPLSRRVAPPVEPGRPTDDGVPDGVPVVALAAAYGGAAALLLADLVTLGLSLAAAALGTAYAAHALGVALLPALRPALYERCRLRPSAAALAVGCGVGAVAGGALTVIGLTGNPETTLSLTLHDPAFHLYAFELAGGPFGDAVPSLLAWQLVGVVVYFVADDYREAEGLALDPPAADYRAVESDSDEDDGNGRRDAAADGTVRDRKGETAPGPDDR